MGVFDNKTQVSDVGPEKYVTTLNPIMIKVLKEHHRVFPTL